MQFLYPKFLWALLAIAIPIIIHLFNFRKYKTIYFSNVQFLQNIKKETKSKSTLKNLLLLLLRVLAICFLVFAFAKPYIPLNKNAKTLKDPLVVVYIDNSFSMEAEGKYGMLLENAKMDAVKISESFPFNTKYLLLTNNFELKHQQTVNKEQFNDWVSQLESTHVLRTINEVFDKAAVLISEEYKNHPVQYFLLSDFQKSVFDTHIPFVAENHKVFTVNIENNQSNNLFIDSVWFESPGHFKGKKEKLFVSITNASNIDYSEIPLSFYINDTLKSMVSFSVEALKKQRVQVSFIQWHAGANQAKVQIDDYPVNFDNDYYMNWIIKEKMDVLLVNDEKSPKFFEALYNKDENFNLTKVKVLSLQYNVFPNYPIIILNELEKISSGLRVELQKYMKQGGQIVLIPSEKGNIEQYNHLIEQNAGIRLSEWREEKGSVSRIDEKNRLFEAAIKNDLEKVKFPDYNGFFKMYLSNTTLSNTLIFNEAGNSIFIQIPFGKGQLFVSAVPMNKNITDFGTHPLFVPLFYNLALHSNTQQINSYWIQPSLFFKLKTSFDNDFPVELVSQENDLNLSCNKVYENGQLRLYPEISQLKAGHFDITSNQNMLHGVSLNYDRKESILDYYSASEIESKLTSMGVETMANLQSKSNLIERDIQKENSKNELSLLMLGLALLFLLSEMLVIRFMK
ncbi:MAG: BatA domain-containing protein [Salinivirgaceae bacterium]|nr:BatA domain-containing protein [Salinivirgaceae bacterium]